MIIVRRHQSSHQKGEAMKCPKCNQTPMPFLRFLFTSKGVGWKRAVQGQLLCEKCGSSLQIRSQSLGVRFWIPTLLFILLFLIEAILKSNLAGLLGLALTSVVFIATILAAGFVGSFLEWKYFKLDEVQSANAA
jgi:hypothetical protein